MTTTALVRCDEAAWQAVEQHVFSSLDREVGGVLVGRIDDDEAVVTTALPALAATSSSANVTFTHEVWEHVHATIDRDHPGERIVGWYHSHPGFGIFLSEYDRFAHATFFDDPALLALVVDPHSAQAGWFALRDGEPRLIASRGTDSAAAKPTQHTTTPPDRGAGRTAVVGLALAVGVLAFFAGSVTSTRTVVKTVQSAAPTVEAQPAAPDLPPADSATPATGARAPAVPAPALDYRVRAGDSFWLLAGSFYGDPRVWPRLKAANLAHSSDALEVGEHLKVPVSLEVSQ